MRYLKTVLEELEIRYLEPIQPLLLPNMPHSFHSQASLNLGARRPSDSSLGNAGSFQGSEFMRRAPGANLRAGESTF